MRNVILSPYSRPLKNGKVNPKNYPYFDRLVQMIKSKGCHVIQIGRTGEKILPGVEDMRYDLSLDDIKELIKNSEAWISVDNFLPHLCNLIGVQGYVIFGPSDPNIFGHPLHVNILKDRKYLREKQFDIWEVCECNNDAFLSPEEIMRIMNLQQSICVL